MTNFIHRVVDGKKTIGTLIAIIYVRPIDDDALQIFGCKPKSGVLFPIINECSRSLDTSKHNLLFLLR